MKYCLCPIFHLSHKINCLSFGELLAPGRCSLKFKKIKRSKYPGTFFFFFFFQTIYETLYICCECMLKNPVALISTHNLSYFIQTWQIYAHGNKIVMQYILYSRLSRVQKHVFSVVLWWYMKFVISVKLSELAHKDIALSQENNKKNVTSHRKNQCKVRGNSRRGWN